MSLVSENQAIELLGKGQVVALPTETVYGLAGKIDSDVALGKIFSTKSRPFYDPLIVHVSDLNQAQKYGQWDRISEKLAQSFWPGPLTLVVDKKNNISDLITNAGSTVAFRQPNHQTFLAVLKGLNIPLAAPSANMFGKTSPTSAQHVLDEFDSQVPVVDGGACEMGIESTVVQVIGNEVRILRHGVITKTQLEEALTDESTSVTVRQVQQTNAPGHLKNHYQPEVPLFLSHEKNLLETEVQGLLSSQWQRPFIKWTLPENPHTAARRLYADLRNFSRSDQACFLVVESHMKTAEWQGILDRLDKACTGYLVRAEDQTLKLENK